MKNIDKIRGLFLSGTIVQATNSDILKITGIKTHQQVYKLTAKLVSEGFLSWKKEGRGKLFFLASNNHPAEKKQEQSKKSSSIQALLNLGFEDVGIWELGGEKIKNKLTKYASSKQVLYAFVIDEKVLYIGKTIRSLSQRLYGYANPGSSQSTNIKNNKKIKTILERGEEIKIFVFAPQKNEVAYKGIPVNLAAGLEDNLISILQPPWNDTGK